MKVNKHICIEVDIVDKLSNIENLSGLIEQLLTDYIKNNKPNHEKIDEKKAEIKDFRKKIAQIRTEMKQLTLVNKAETEFKSVHSKLLEQNNLRKDAHLWYYGKDFEKNRGEMLKSNHKDIIEFYKFKKGVK